MKWICRGWWLVLISACFGVQAETLTYKDITLWGAFSQGGMAYGKAPVNAAIQYGKRRLRLTPQGQFVFGFGRDDKPKHNLSVTLASGEQYSVPIVLQQREYNLQRVEGVPARTVNPDPKHLARIREEASEVTTARNTESDIHGFLQTFVWPLQGPITGVYGSQRIYNGEPRRPHYGVDIAAPKGTRIISPADGVVTLAHSDMFFSGATMVIDHGHGISTSYLHMSEMAVKAGDKVQQGQVIGLVGASGRATGPHLCWRLNWYQTKLDPQLVVPKLAPAGL
jgi:murein DD-endopeptidase MepM/ murein hydrolase activator NlpD